MHLLYHHYPLPQLHPSVILTSSTDINLTDINRATLSSEAPHHDPRSPCKIEFWKPRVASRSELYGGMTRGRQPQNAKEGLSHWVSSQMGLQKTNTKLSLCLMQKDLIYIGCPSFQTGNHREPPAWVVFVARQTGRMKDLDSSAPLS